MAGKYDAVAATALRQISAKGGSAILRRPAGTAGFEPVTQTFSEGSPKVEVKASMVKLPAGQQARYRIPELVTANTQEFHIALRGVTLQPAPGDEIDFKGTTYKVLWARTYDPAGDGAIYAMAYGEA